MRQQLIITSSTGNRINVVLPSNFKVTIKRTNPLFNDEGDFSFPFSLSTADNRELIQSACDPHGRFSIRRLNNLSCEYWFDGILLFRGYTEVNDTVEFKDTISINFNSGIKTITERIKDMNAQDVSVEELQLGYACTGFRASGVSSAYYLEDSNKKKFMVNLHRPAYDTGYTDAPVKNALYTFTSALNIDKDSRSFPYCNTRVCMDIENENKLMVLDYNRRDAAPCMFVLYWLKRLFHDLDIAVINEFEQMEDMCRLAFFSTFPKYELRDWDNDSIPNGFHVETNEYNSQRIFYASWEKWSSIVPQFGFGAPFSINTEYYHNNICVGYWFKTGSNHMVGTYDNYAQPAKTYQWTSDSVKSVNTDEKLSSKDVVLYGFQPAYLSPEQYPDIEAKTIINDLHDIFGLRVIFDTAKNTARVCYIKDILNGNSIKFINGDFLESPRVTRYLNSGIVVSYGSNVDGQATNVEEGAYDYTMPSNWKNEDGTDKYDENGNLQIDPVRVVYQSMSNTLSMTFRSTDTRTYYDGKTCNAIRIMVDEGSDEPNQGALPFEVGQYNDYRAFVTDEDNTKTITASFRPVDCNDVFRFTKGYSSLSQSDICPFVDAQQTIYSSKSVFSSDGSDDNSYKMYETFSVESEDIRSSFEMTNYGMELKYHDTILAQHSTIEYESYGYLLVMYNWYDDYDAVLDKFSIILRFANNNTESCDMTSSDSPLQKWQDDKHYVLGFMRGAGNDSGVEYDSNEYTADGTRGWKTVVSTPTFTADSVDQFGNVFDYNGSAAGGTDQSQRLSLKLDARKVYGYDEDGNPDFYPTTDDELAKRGVVAKMLDKYIYLMTHKKTVTHKAQVAIGAIMDIDWCSQYNLQQCVGFINSVQLELSESGVGQSTIEQYVIE